MTAGILSPEAKSTNGYSTQKGDSVGLRAVSQSDAITYVRQPLNKANDLNDDSSNASHLTKKRIIGVCFKSELDTEAYASRIAKENHFEVVLISRQEGSLRTLHSSVDLLLTDRCLCNEPIAFGTRFHEPEINASTKILRLQKEFMPSCNCCRTLPGSSSWGELLMIMGNALGLSPLTSGDGRSDDASLNEASQPARKQTPAARRGLPRELDALTRREIDILQLVGRGMSVREMAHELNLAESTIGNHKYRLMRKLDVSSSLGLLRISVRCGLSEL